MNRLFRQIVFFIALLYVASCSHKELSFTILATEKLDYSRMNEYRKARKQVTGQDITNFILFIPLGLNNIQAAVEDALNEIPGAVGLVDGIISYNFWTTLFFGRTYYEVKGIPLIDMRMRSKTKQEKRDKN